MMIPEVKRIEDSIAHHQPRFRTISRVLQFPTSLKVDEVYATGFPFKFQVAVKNAKLSTVEIDETFAVVAPLIILERINAGQGTYRVNLPTTVQAMYAKQGSAPEHYTATVSEAPKLNLSAADSKIKCGPMTGKTCADIDPKAPLISYALGIPKSVTMTMTLGKKSRTEIFQFSPIEINVPIYREIPMDIDSPLHIFVGVLREGLVYNTPSGQ